MKGIAGLQNLDEGDVRNVIDNNVKFQSPREKAEEILSMISKKHPFSREEFARHLKEEGFANLVDGVLNGTYRDDTNSQGASPTTAAAEN